MKNNKILLLIGLAVLIGGLWIAMQRVPRFSSLFSKPQETVVPSSNAATDSTPQATFPVFLTLKYGSLRPDESFTVDITQGQSVLEAVQKLKGDQVTTKEYSFGTLVEGISGVTNGTDKKYWLYKVNNQEASVSATAFILQPNDQVLWEFKASDQ